MLCCNPCNIGCISHLLLHAELFVNPLRWRMIAFPVISRRVVYCMYSDNIELLKVNQKC